MRSGALDTPPQDATMDHYDPRWADDRDRSMPVERDRDRPAGRPAGDRHDREEADPFTYRLDLPRGKEREAVVDRERVYELSGRESCALASIGAFRVIDVDDLRVPERDAETRRPEPDIQHLRESGLVETRSLDGCGREA